MPVDTTELRRLAEAATNWGACWHKADIGTRIWSPSDVLSIIPDAGTCRVAQAGSRELAAYIAAANPAVVLALLAERDRLWEALSEIAAFNDNYGEARLAIDGSFASFDEPASVEIARAALKGTGHE